MKKPGFSVEQIVSVLKQAELGLPVADLIRQIGISEQTFHRCKKQYAGLESDRVRELKQVLGENTEAGGGISHSAVALTSGEKPIGPRKGATASRETVALPWKRKARSTGADV